MRPITWIFLCAFLLFPACQEYGGVVDSGQPEDDGETIDPGDCCGPDEPAWHDDIPGIDDGGPQNDGDRPDPPDMPADGGPQCERPGQPGQGRDRDGDMWGEYCDCDDLNPAIYPRAPELCDGLDNNCDGQVDPPGTCPEECPIVAGEVLILADCLGFGMVPASIGQYGCEITIRAVGMEFWGLIEPGGFIVVDLENPFALTCEGRVHRSGFPVGLNCGDCVVKVLPDEFLCWRNEDCQPGLSCQMSLDQATMNMTTTCDLTGGPNTDNTGEACQLPGDCYSLWCHDYPGYCAGICLTDSDCPGPEFVCATQVIELDLSASGEILTDWMNVCAPARRDCETNAECPTTQVCELVADPIEFEGFVRACGQEPGAGWLGADCDDSLLDGCATGICVVEGRYCSNFCVSDQDCVDPTGELYSCREAPVEIWPGYHLPVRVCAR